MKVWFYVLVAVFAAWQADKHADMKDTGKTVYWTGVMVSFFIALIAEQYLTR